MARVVPRALALADEEHYRDNCHTSPDRSPDPVEAYYCQLVPTLDYDAELPAAALTQYEAEMPATEWQCQMLEWYDTEVENSEPYLNSPRLLYALYSRCRNRGDGLVC
jgi:hypothetical protein